MHQNIMPLSQAKRGGEYEIISMASERLSVFGMSPGTKFRLSQTRPSFVIRAGETELAFDLETAEGIRVIFSNS